jgi:hypothetical protein
MATSNIETYFLIASEGDPKCSEIFIKTALLFDPEMKFLNKFHPNNRINFINSLDQKNFNDHLSGKFITETTAILLNPEKIKLWYDQNKTSFNGDQHFLIRRLVTAGLINAKDVMQTFYNCWLPTILTNENTNKEWYNTFEILLMHLDETADASWFEGNTSPKINSIMMKYYFNRCKMLELECQTKDHSLKQYETSEADSKKFVEVSKKCTKKPQISSSSEE